MTDNGVVLVHTEDGYFLRVGGEESEVHDYGVPVEMVVGEVTYIAYADIDEDGVEVQSNLSSWVYKAEPVECREVMEEGEGEDKEEGTEEGKDSDNSKDEVDL